MPEISIVIPLYNKAAYIERTLKSVLSQTYPDFEVVVVDDGSTDNSVNVAKNVKDPRIRLVQQQNQGVSAARNRGIDEARSELIAFLDADDEWTPTFVEVILNLRKAYPGAGIYATAFKKRLQDGKEKNIEFKVFLEEQKTGLIPYFKAVAEGPLLVRSSNLAIPRNVFADVGNFSTSDWWGEDTEVWGKIAVKYPVAYSRDVCMIYNIDTVNSAANKIKCVQEHPFVRTGKKLLNEGKVPPEMIDDFKNYVDKEIIYTAKRNLLGGDKKLARENLRNCSSKCFTRQIRVLLLQTYLPHKLYVLWYSFINYLYNIT